MRRSGVGAGGGIGNRKVIHSRAPKTEPIANKYRPQGVSQLGNKQGSHVTHERESSYRGEKLRGGRGYEPPGMISDPVKAVGVGGGRTVMKSGQQNQWGQPASGNPPAQGRDTLREFGPDYKR